MSWKEYDKVRRGNFACSTFGHEGHAEESTSTPVSVTRISSSSLIPRPRKAGSTYIYIISDRPGFGISRASVFFWRGSCIEIRLNRRNHNQHQQLQHCHSLPSPWMQVHSSQAQEWWPFQAGEGRSWRQRGCHGHPCLGGETHGVDRMWLFLLQRISPHQLQLGQCLAGFAQETPKR